MVHKLFWTKEDKSLFSHTLVFASKLCRGTQDLSSVSGIINCFKEANENLSRRTHNDCPKEIETLLTDSQWKKVWVEFHHYNGDLEEIGNPVAYGLPDFCLLYFFITKLEKIKNVPV